MFKIRYDMTGGQLKRTSKGVVGARRNVRTANTCGMGGGGAALNRYSPVFERAEDPSLAFDFLPADPQTQNKLFRQIIDFDPIAGPATEYWRDIAFSDNVILGGIKDEKVIQFYYDAIEASGIEAEMPKLLGNYLIYGSFVFHMIMDESLGYWTEVIIDDPDFVSVQASPFPSQPPIIDLQPSREWSSWATSNDPRIKDQRQNIDPVVLKYMAAGKSIPLAPENSMFLPRKAYAEDHYGTSYLTRILPFWIYEKATMDASIAGARRKAGPLYHVTAWIDASPGELQALDELFAVAEEDPIGGRVITREGVTVNPIGGGGGDIWKWSDEADVISTAKMRALGISETFLCLSGDTYIPTKEWGLVRIDGLPENENEQVQNLDITVSGKSGPARTSKWKYSGYADTLSITTKQGYSIQATPEHRILTLDDGNLVWKESKNLTPGDYLCVSTKPLVRNNPLLLDIPEHVPSPETTSLKQPTKPEYMTPSLAFILGMIVSKGCHTRNGVRVCNSDGVLNGHYIDLVHQIFSLDTTTTCGPKVRTDLVFSGVETKTPKPTHEILLQSKIIAEWLTYLGVVSSDHYDEDKKSSHKEVPWSVLQADGDSQLAYIAAYIESHGALNNESDISIFSQSEKNLNQLQVILSSHGIISKHTKDYHCLYVNAVQARKLHAFVSPYLVNKNGSDEHLSERKNAEFVGTVIPTEFITALLKTRFVRQEHLGLVFKNDDNEETLIPRGDTAIIHMTSRTHIIYSSYHCGEYDEFIAVLNKISSSCVNKIKLLMKEEYCFDPVQEIFAAGKSHVFDISMREGEEPAFVANGLVVHNSGDATYNSMETVLSVFLEKVRSIRSLFTKKVIHEKILRQLAVNHGFYKTPESQIRHGYRIAKKQKAESELLLPTIEWNRPLEPVADREFLDLLREMEEKGFPVPARTWAQATGYDIDRTLEGQEGDMETRRSLMAYNSAIIKQNQEFGFDAEGTFTGVEEEEEFGGGFGGFDEEELGEGIGEEEFEAPTLEEAPAIETPEEGAGASLARKRFPAKKQQLHRVEAVTAGKDVSQYKSKSPRQGGRSQVKDKNIERTLGYLPLWDQGDSVFGLRRRHVAKILDEIDHTDPDRRTQLLDKLPASLRRREGLTPLQTEALFYIGMRLGYLPKHPLSTEAYESLGRLVVNKMNGSGMTRNITKELMALSSLMKTTGKVKRDPTMWSKALPLAERELPHQKILSGVTE